MNNFESIKIIQHVAAGGTAVLYKAVQTSLDRIVAVKRLHQHLTDDSNFTRRFILEAKAAASLDHPNIVRVIDFGQHEGCYQMVMEYVEGESLKEILERWRPVKCHLALALARQILLGLEHAHGKGIVHRDIKPGNVMLTEQGGVKITDFGLAKLTQSPSSHTAADSIIGTPLYMSPEQAFGESVDQRSDLFSLGTVLYELLTGEQPFASQNYMGVIQNITNDDAPRVSETTPEIPAEVDAIVARALARNRDERFQTAREFREAIEEYLGNAELAEHTSRLRLLLEKSTVTQILPSTEVPRGRRRGGARNTVGVLVLLGLLAGAAVVTFDPSLRDRLVGKRPALPSQPQESAADAGTYDFDISDVLDADHAAAGSTSIQVDTLSPVSTEKPDTGRAAPPTAPAPSGASETRASEREPQPEPKAPVKRVGYLRLATQPPAEVWIDGQYRGDTPERLTLRAGKHSLELRHPRHETYAEVLKITSGELSQRDVALKRLRGNISLSTLAGAELYVDGVLYGTTPVLKPIALDSGPHMLTIKKSGYFTWSNEVTVEPKKTLPLKITLSPRY